MGKSIHFTGQPVFSQLTKLLPKAKILQLAREYQADRYTKSFTTWNHLVTMLFAAFTKCQGLRELESGMSGFSARLSSMGVTHTPPKSTLADANIRRPSELFEAIFRASYRRLRSLLPDSRLNQEGWLRRILLIDSTTITLFKEILKSAGRSPANGKRKGGVKVHVGMKLDELVPALVRITSAATHDVTFLQHLGDLVKGTILVFDKAYLNFKCFNQWSKDGIIWVTRLKKWPVVSVLEDLPVSKKNERSGIRCDQLVELGHDGQDNKVICRLVSYYDKDTDKVFEFICNSRKFSPLTIARIYKQRWQIELLFKRLKQNLQMDNFLGDNENAIRIQIWCNLLADLLIAVVKSRLKRPKAYSVVAGIIRIHLMNYVDVIKLLTTPGNKNIFWDPIQNPQIQIRFRDPPMLPFE
jgi:hypothetical protein